MQRRELLVTSAALVSSTVGLSLVGSCGWVPLLPQMKRARVGYFISQSLADPIPAAQYAAFRAGMAEASWVEGQNLTLDLRYAEGHLERLPGLAAELAGVPVDVLVAGGTDPSLVAKDAAGTVPVVFFNVGDPVGSGLVGSLAHPGGHVTGVSVAAGPDIQLAKQLDVLRSTLPGLARVALLFNGLAAAPLVQLPPLEDPAKSGTVETLRLEIRSVADFEAAFAQARAWQAQSLIVVNEGSLINLQYPLIADLALRSQLPTIDTFRQYPEVGGLMSYGPDNIAHARRVAYFVDRILRGAAPADLPVELPTTFELVVNAKTAQALGLTIPPDVESQVTHWIQ